EFEVERHVEDGDRVEAGQKLLSVTTRTRDLLTAERSALNLLCVARVLVAAALLREETRGCHWREDHADRDDTAWRRHIVVRLNPDRTLAVRTTDTADFPPTLPARPGRHPQEQ
ncbi:MAG TPA: L-aspartate oxidase, partial [Streptomyces sp.]|nr:L-aspartate oxidase [Streptomyces sp.]